MLDLQRIFAVLLALFSCSTAHLFLTYPGTRGDNLHTNLNKTGQTCRRGSGDDYAGDKGCFPYGMQWMYPCGGLGLTTNRTKWPLNGGAVAFQPGWQTGHSTAFIYINIGLGTWPKNMSHPVVPVFQLTSPTNDPYPDKQVCIPQVGMPANLSLAHGDNITIQVVEAAKHGAALYSCVDVTLTNDTSEVTQVTKENCFNSSDLGFNMVFSTISLKNEGFSSLASPSLLGTTAIALGVIAGGLLL